MLYVRVRGQRPPEKPKSFIRPGVGLLLKCFHHKASLCIRPTAAYLDLVCPMFCCIKQLYNANHLQWIVDEIGEIINEELVYVKDFAPLNTRESEWTAPHVHSVQNAMKN